MCLAAVSSSSSSLSSSSSIKAAADLGGPPGVPHHHHHDPSARFPPAAADRIGMFLVVSKYARGLAVLLMVAAYLGQQQQQQQQAQTSESPSLHETTTTTNHYNHPLERWFDFGLLSEQSLLVLIYALIVKLVLRSSSNSNNNNNGGINQYGMTQMIQESITTAAVTRRVSSNPTMMRIRSTVSASSLRLLALAGGGGDAAAAKHARNMAIADRESFLAVDDIAQMTLSDMRNLFRYAVQLGGRSFDRASFLQKLNRRCQRAIHAIDQVTLLSRGGAPPPLTADPAERAHHHHHSLPLDALHFAAAVRIFAEWRTVRLVPNHGTSARYALGMSMARRDLIQNVRKLEAAAHDWIKYHHSHHHHDDDDTSADKSNRRAAAAVTSPTLRQLLQHEVAQNIHPALPRLHDKSAASGLLWAKRQLEYQNLVFANLSQVPVAYPDAKSAVLAAYQSTYENYHGFLVRNVFQSSFDAAPPADTILEFMNLPSKMTAKESKLPPDDITEADGDESSCGPFPVEASQEPLVHDEQRHASSFQKHQPLHDPKKKTTTTTTSLQRSNPLHDVGQHLKNELVKLTDFFGQCTGHPRNESHDRSRDILNDLDAGDDDATPAATRAQRDDLADFVTCMQEILMELNRLITEFNMSDPSKV